MRPREGLESDIDIRFIRYLWIVSAAMVLAGFALVVGSFAASMGPIALICGVLLLWSGTVKVIVLRIWRATLTSHPAPDRARHVAHLGSTLGQRS